MKKTIVYVSVIICVLLSGCMKEGMGLLPEGAIEIFSEKIDQGDAKMHTNGNDSYWQEGDVLTINGQPFVVHVVKNESGHDLRCYIQSGGQGNSSLSIGNTYNGYFNCGNVTNAQSTTPTVTLPKRYVVNKSHGYVDIDLPMAARFTLSERENGVSFRHLTGALVVRPYNTYMNLESICIDSVMVISDKYKISGSTPVTLSGNTSNGAQFISVQPEELAAGQKDTVTLVTGSEFWIQNFEDLQVPIRPIGDGGKLVVKIFSHTTADKLYGQGLAKAHISYNYTCTPTDNTSSIARAWGRYAQIKLRRSSLPSGMVLDSVIRGVFTMTNGNQVRFAQGNMLETKTTLNELVYSLADHQYDDVDGVSLYNLVYYVDMPITFVHEYVEQADFPYNRRLVNGGYCYSWWRTLSTNEWTNIVNRTRFQARVNDTPGLVLACDGWVAPNGMSIVLSTNNPNDNIFSIADWEKLEALGCVFLPYTKNYSDWGHYWAATPREQKEEDAGTSYMGGFEYYYYVETLRFGNQVAPSDWWDVSNAKLSIRPVRRLNY